MYAADPLKTVAYNYSVLSRPYVQWFCWRKANTIAWAYTKCTKCVDKIEVKTTVYFGCDDDGTSLLASTTKPADVHIPSLSHHLCCWTTARSHFYCWNFTSRAGTHIYEHTPVSRSRCFTILAKANRTEKLRESECIRIRILNHRGSWIPRLWLRTLSVSSILLCTFVAVYLTFVQFILRLKLCVYTTVHLLLK